MTGALDLGSLATRCTPIAPEVAADLARATHGIAGRLTRLATEKDDTFHIRTDDGAELIYKIANPGESMASLDLQVQCLRHLERVAPDLPVPRVVPATSGALLVPVPSAEGPRQVRVMSYLSGDLLDGLPPDPAEQRLIGAMAARLRLALAEFSHPAADHVLAWDVRHLPALAGLVDQVPDAGQRALLARAFAQITALAPRIDALPRQIVHNDFNRSNLLVNRAGPPQVTGIIDFGDVVHTAIAIDLATAMLNQLPRDAAERGTGGMFDGPLRVLAGYLPLAPLRAEERRLLPHLVFARVVTRALLSLWRARQFPENRTYILRHTAPCWDQLDWYLSHSPAALDALMP